MQSQIADNIAYTTTAFRPERLLASSAEPVYKLSAHLEAISADDGPQLLLEWSQYLPDQHTSYISCHCFCMPVLYYQIPM